MLYRVSCSQTRHESLAASCTFACKRNTCVRERTSALLPSKGGVVLQEHRRRSHATLVAMLAATDATTAARAAQLLATAFWHDRAAEARDAAIEGLALKRVPDAATMAAAALLPPPPQPGASGSDSAADALVAALRAPTTARGAARILVDAVAQLFATALACKQDLGPQGGARSTGQHLMIVVATLAAAVQWLRVLQHSAQRGPMLRLVRLLLEMLTVPRPSGADDDSARHGGGRAAADGAHSPAPHLSPISLFLQGACPLSHVYAVTRALL